MTTTVHAMAALLEEFGIELISVDRRTRLAGVLVEEGFTVAQIEAVGRHIEQTTPDLAACPAILFAALTGDLQALRERAASCAAFLAARARRQDPAGGDRNVNPPPPVVRDRVWLRRRAWGFLMDCVCTFKGSVDAVAEALGVSADEVRALVDEERAERERDGGAALPMLDRRTGEIRHPKVRGAQSVFQANEERDRAMAERRRRAFGDAYEQAGRAMPSNVREAIGGAP